MKRCRKPGQNWRKLARRLGRSSPSIRWLSIIGSSDRRVRLSLIEKRKSSQLQEPQLAQEFSCRSEGGQSQRQGEQEKKSQGCGASHRMTRSSRFSERKETVPFPLGPFLRAKSISSPTLTPKPSGDEQPVGPPWEGERWETF